MAQWDYTTVAIRPDGRARRSWTGSGPDGSALEGLDLILQAYGRRGWELVNLVTEEVEFGRGFTWPVYTTGCRAVFKRPLTEPQEANR